MRKPRIQSGEKYGKLTTVNMIHKESSSGRIRSHWICLCDCGTQVVVDSGNLRRKNSTQCSECTAKSRSERRKTHGQTKSSSKGTRLLPSKAYRTWQNTKRRCLNPNDKRYPDYGGRGITVCDEWIDSFENFYRDMGDPPSGRHSIDRIDNNGPYDKQNCRWATQEEQGSNKRNNVLVVVDGESMSLSEACRRSEIDYDTIRKRVVDLGWPIEKALSLATDRKGKGGRIIKTPQGEFESLSECSRVLGIPVSSIFGRLKSDIYRDWYYADDVPDGSSDLEEIDPSRNIRSESQKAIWKRPEVREARIIKRNITVQGESFRKKMSESTTKQMSDPSARAAISAKHKERMKDPANRAKSAEGARKGWLDPEKREARIQAMKAAKARRREAKTT